MHMIWNITYLVIITYRRVVWTPSSAWKGLTAIRITQSVPPLLRVRIYCSHLGRQPFYKCPASPASDHWMLWLLLLLLHAGTDSCCQRRHVHCLWLRWAGRIVMLRYNFGVSYRVVSAASISVFFDISSRLVFVLKGRFRICKRWHRI